MPILRILLLCGPALFVFGCTLKTYQPQVEVRVAFPPAEASPIRGARSGPALADMKCYGLVVKEAPNPVTSEQIGGRLPICLRLQGGFYGPYSYSELTSGVKISLAAGSYTFSVTGFHGISNCSGGLPALLGARGAAETYSVGEEVVADLRVQTSVTLSGANYNSATAVNREPLCQPITTSCNGAYVCDTFTATDLTPLNFHNNEVVAGWTSWASAEPNIIGNAVLMRGYNLSGVRAYSVTPVGTQSATATIVGQLGSNLGESGLGVVLRYRDEDNLALGELVLSNSPDLCFLRILEIDSGAQTVVASMPLSYADDCPRYSNSLLVFSLNVTTYTLIYKGQQLQGPASLNTGFGFFSGFSYFSNGSGSGDTTVDFYKAVLN